MFSLLKIVCLKSFHAVVNWLLLLMLLFHFRSKIDLLELVLLITFAGLIYVGYEIWGKQYFKGVAPVKAKKVSAAKASSPVASGPSTTSATGYDTNWIPESHLKQKKTKKVN